MACTHILHLMTPQVIWCTWLWYTASSLHLCGKISKIYNFDLLDTTSQRKLAHIQRVILLKFHFNSITDIPVGTCPLAICDQSVLPVPSLFYFIFISFQNTVVSIQLGKIIPILGSRTKIYTVQLKHGCKQQIWHIELHCDSRQVKSNSCFLILQMNNLNNRDNRPQIQQFLSPTKGITQIFEIFEPFPTYTISSLVETFQITRIFGIGHQLSRLSQIIQSICVTYGVFMVVLSHARTCRRAHVRLLTRGVGRRAQFLTSSRRNVVIWCRKEH